MSGGRNPCGKSTSRGPLKETRGSPIQKLLKNAIMVIKDKLTYIHWNENRIRIREHNFFGNTMLSH
jgi:hypothetical protein